jgi:xanthine/CO dehydrogenase XdhC/CoxF family maturation factor
MSKEIRDILAALKERELASCALATVVRAEGSSYRKVGARMLVGSTGILAGCVSGGCLEADVVERAQEAIETGTPVVLRYDTRFDEAEIVFGWGTGCSGLIEVLIEPLTSVSIPLALPIAADERRECVVLATMYGGSRTEVNRALFGQDGNIIQRSPETKIADDFNNLAGTILSSGRSQTLETCVGSVCFEYIPPSRNLLIYGCGPDAIALMHLAQNVGWTVTLADHRATTADRYAAAECRIACRPETLFDHVCVDDQTALVSMSHNYLVDLELLQRASASSLRYVGVLGSNARARRLKGELEQLGLPHTLYGRLHAPVGLQIGASTPEMIALSIVAEIESVFNASRGTASCLRQTTILSA